MTFTEKKRAKGIYELAGDTLKIALGDPDNYRPGDFSGKNGATVMVLKRAK